MADIALLDLPTRLSPSDLADYIAGRRAVLTGRVGGLATDLPMLAQLPVIGALSDAPEDTEMLVVVGGGMRIDAAKAWRGLHRKHWALLAIPTRYGSGAEANNIAVLDAEGAKTIHIGPEFRPDARAYVPQVLDSLSEADLMWCAGDALTHAVEGLLSPLAKPDLRVKLAYIIGEMLRLRPNRDPVWFELSAVASAGQAQASVGLVHGLAHVLEAPARAALGEAAREIGHARLCAGLLAPVLRFNLVRSEKTALRLSQAGIDCDALLTYASSLSGPALDLPLDWPRIVENHWMSILRDPCTRANVAVVRPSALPDLIAELSH